MFFVHDEIHYVYLIRLKFRNVILHKIGRTNNMATRMQDHKIKHGDIELINSFEFNCRWIHHSEVELLKLFKNKRYKNYYGREYFVFDDDDISRFNQAATMLQREAEKTAWPHQSKLILGIKNG